MTGDLSKVNNTSEANLTSLR